jgi:CheY-like chemotaxis protein
LGLTTKFKKNGLEVLEILNDKSKVDIIITNIHMTLMDGIEFPHEIILISFKKMMFIVLIFLLMINFQVLAN